MGGNPSSLEDGGRWLGRLNELNARKGRQKRCLAKGQGETSRSLRYNTVDESAAQHDHPIAS